MQSELKKLFYDSYISKDQKHKVIKILGVKCKFRRRNFNEDIYEMCHQILTKLSLPDNIFRLNNTKFYVPNYPLDTIQRWIVDKSEFYEEELLKELEHIIPNDAVICDIGANIGNHSLYWASNMQIKKIYAFEPVDTTYNILEKNIKINNLENIIKPLNIGLSDEKGTGIINIYSNDNIGGTSIKKSNQNNGGIKIDKLDNIKIIEEKLDFIKIDVEGHELLALKGAKQTINKYKPLIFIEIFPENFEELNKLLLSYQYKLTQKFCDNNYLFAPDEI